jgi:hypothetical protein
MELLAFISYSHKDRKLAGFIKSGLEAFGFHTFLAHEDLAPSAEWQDTILRKLKACHVFLPLITRHFHASSWTDQEVGAAVILKKCIVPLKVGNNPYGFMGKFQAQKISSRSEAEIESYCWLIVRSLCDHRGLVRNIKEALIDRFVDSGSFRESARFAGYLESIGEFTDEQLDKLIRGAAQNSQVYSGYVARKFVDELAHKERSRIGQKRLNEYKRMRSS